MLFQSVRGSGRVVEEKRQVQGVTGVHLTGSGTLHVELGDREAFRIEAEANLIEYLYRGEHIRSRSKSL